MTVKSLMKDLYIFMNAIKINIDFIYSKKNPYLDKN